MTKIAFPTEDGQTISAHFGRAPFFVVATVGDGETVQFERRAKPAHGQPGQVQLMSMDGDPATHHGPEHDHSDGPHQHMHGAALSVIADCEVLIARGMGQPMYEHAVSAGMQVFMAGESRIDAALVAYRAGALTGDLRRVHNH